MSPETSPEKSPEVRRTRWSGVMVVVAAVLVAAVALGWWLAAKPGDVVRPPTRQAAAAGTTLHARSFCSTGATTPFSPTGISIPGVIRRVPVLALPRDANGVPGALPLTDAAKHEFAWDEPPGIKPGAARGNVLMNAHTWPWSSAPAMGNLLLLHLRPGHRIVLWGAHTHLCYTVTKQVQIGADQSYPAYYSRTGRPRLAVIVCSGVRAGPGDWLSRTIWFASPVSSSATTAQRSGAGPQTGSTS